MYVTCAYDLVDFRKDALPPLTPQLESVKLKSPIEQHMLGHGGLFRQQNVEKRRVYSVREWAELSSKEDRRAPSVDDIGLQHARRAAPPPPPKSRAKKGERTKADATKAASAGPVSIPAVCDVDNTPSSANVPVPTSPKSPPADGDAKVSEHPTDVPSLPTPERLKEEEEENTDEDEKRDDKPQPTTKPKRKWQTREMRDAHLAERAAADAVFMRSFNPHTDWLPPNTRPEDYTPEFCKDLERRYWRNCGFGAPAMYGADMEGSHSSEPFFASSVSQVSLSTGSLFTDKTKAWNVARLPSLLSRLLPSSSNGLPGVNTPYLYFGMWRATFAWHVEDMDLFSINYIHFGAGKFWYAVPQARASALEQTMRGEPWENSALSHLFIDLSLTGHFPEPSRCPQFLRHKSYLASPMMLAKTSCRPNTLVQHAGEFVITFPRGYHAGFNLGFNCAESVNFALESWIELGRKAQACNCVNYRFVDYRLSVSDIPMSMLSIASASTSTSFSVIGNLKWKRQRSPNQRPRLRLGNASQTKTRHRAR
jgi:JmjC domain, hydroxylase